MFPTISIKISQNYQLRQKLRLGLGQLHEDFFEILEKEQLDKDEFECALTDLNKTLGQAYEIMKEVAETPETIEEEDHMQAKIIEDKKQADLKNPLSKMSLDQEVE